MPKGGIPLPTAPISTGRFKWSHWQWLGLGRTASLIWTWVVLCFWTSVVVMDWPWQNTMFEHKVAHTGGVAAPRSWAGNRQAVWGGVCVNAGAEPDRRGEERVEPQGAANCLWIIMRWLDGWKFFAGAAVSRRIGEAVSFGLKTHHNTRYWDANGYNIPQMLLVLRYITSLQKQKAIFYCFGFSFVLRYSQHWR